jgi:hypothetical protein
MASAKTSALLTVHAAKTVIARILTARAAKTAPTDLTPIDRVERNVLIGLTPIGQAAKTALVLSSHAAIASTPAEPIVLIDPHARSIVLIEISRRLFAARVSSLLRFQSHPFVKG